MSYKGRKLGLDRPCRRVQLQLLQEHHQRRRRRPRRPATRSSPKERAAPSILADFYWQGKSDGVQPFAGNGARASELMGAMLNAQLDRLDGMIDKMRNEKRRILDGTPSPQQSRSEARRPLNSPEHECSTQVMLPPAERERRPPDLPNCSRASFRARPADTPTPNGTWCCSHEGAAHPALNPFNLPQNQGLRKDYSPDMCASSLGHPEPHGHGGDEPPAHRRRDRRLDP